MKFTTILLVASIAVTVYSADTANCSNGTTSFWCVKCGASDCAKCYGGFVDSVKCAAPTTPVENCAVYATATTCSMCKDGYYLASTTSCTANPSTVTGCAVYQKIDATVYCMACSSGLPTVGATVTFSGTDYKTVTTCSSTAHGTGCTVSKPGTIEAPAPQLNRILADGSRRILAAGDITAPICGVCASTHVLNTADDTCTTLDTATHTSGCFSHTLNVCQECRWSTHQMKELGKCSEKPAGYSAILSVVSMIVALMFANF